jgi:hypothetical protein
MRPPCASFKSFVQHKQHRIHWGADAINMDTAEEATRVLETTGVLATSDVPISPASALMSPNTSHYGSMLPHSRSQPRSQNRSQPQAIAEGKEDMNKNKQKRVPEDPHNRRRLQRRLPAFKDLTEDLSISDSISIEGSPRGSTALPSAERNPSKSRKSGIFSQYRTPRSLGVVPDLRPSTSTNNSLADPYLTFSPRNVGAQVSPPALRNKHAYANQLDIDDQTVSIELQRSPLAKGYGCAPNSEAHSYALADHPTGSHPLAPGPYHRANSRLRQLLPLYNASVTVKTSWFHIIMTFLSVLAFLWYIVLRAYYLASGMASKFESQNVNVPYSWVVLAAEIALTGLGFYGHQVYWRQVVKFTEMSDVERNDMVRVCSHPSINCPLASYQPHLLEQ